MMEWLPLLAVGFIAQLVDGALGMAFGLVSTSAMLALGIPLAQASAAVHTAEVFTTAASGAAHWRAGNVNRRLLTVLAAAGATGGVAGALILSNVDGKMIRPFVAGYLMLMGLLILFRCWKRTPHVAADPRHLFPLGLCGGFLDAIGGGGWGPVVTSTLIGSGQTPRYVLGTVALSEFFVTSATATAFFMELGLAHLDHLAALVAGGLLAAPFGSLVAKRMPARVLMLLVGCLICGLAALEFYRLLMPSVR